MPFGLAPLSTTRKEFWEVLSDGAPLVLCSELLEFVCSILLGTKLGFARVQMWKLGYERLGFHGKDLVGCNIWFCVDLIYKVSAFRKS